MLATITSNRRRQLRRRQFAHDNKPTMIAAASTIQTG